MTEAGDNKRYETAMIQRNNGELLLQKVKMESNYSERGFKYFITKVETLGTNNPMS